MGDTLLEANGLVKEYQMKRGISFRAVDEVSFSIRKGETLALVGESGSGKTTVGKIISGVMAPTRGSVLFNAVDITRFRTLSQRRAIQYIYQNPFSSLDPKLRVAAILREPVALYLCLSKNEEARRIALLLEDVGLEQEVLSRYPEELSGGQCQRISIARALAGDPELIVCDEATSALDMPIQSQIINILSRLLRDRGLSYLFISHSLAMVSAIADNVLVMKDGKLVEAGSAGIIFGSPRHPYTKSLLDAVPVVNIPYFKINDPRPKVRGIKP